MQVKNLRPLETERRGTSMRSPPPHKSLSFQKAPANAIVAYHKSPHLYDKASPTRPDEFVGQHTSLQCGCDGASRRSQFMPNVCDDKKMAVRYSYEDIGNFYWHPKFE